MVEVDVLEKFGRETALRKKWMKMWQQLGGRILKFPKWMQVIILQDVHTAIENRVATMEMILKAHERRKGAR